MRKLFAAFSVAALFAFAPAGAQTTFHEAQGPAPGLAAPGTQVPSGPVVIGVHPVGVIPEALVAAPGPPIVSNSVTGPTTIVPAAPGPGAPVVAPPSQVIGVPVAAAPTTQNVVTTTGPVSSDTTISVGTLAGQAFLWMVTAFGGILATALTTLVVKLIQRAGIEATDALRARLQEIVVNGLNLAAQEAAAELKGKVPVQVNAQIKARATEYVMVHGADTIKALGIDPQSAQATEAVHAKIETAIADPAAPTPAVLDKPKILT